MKSSLKSRSGENLRSFLFSPAIQAGIEAGKYLPVFTSAGVPIGMVRDADAGQFVHHAVGVLVNNSPLSALVSPIQFVMGGIQIYQMHRGFKDMQAGFQAVQSSLGVLQATTAVIGVGVAAGVGLSAVNLYQTIKLRKAVERLEVKIENGFIDLKQALREQGAEVKELIERVSQDMKFEQHRRSDRAGLWIVR